MRRVMEKLKRILYEIRKQFESFCVEVLDFKSRRGKIFRRGVLVFASILSVVMLVTAVISDLDNKAVRVLYYGDKKLGVIHSAQVYKNARDDAEAHLALEFGIAYRFPKDSAYYVISSREESDYLTKTEIADYLIKDAEKLFARGFGLYVDNKLIAIGENEADMQSVLDETVQLYRNLYARVKTDEDIIVFASNTRIEKMTVPKSMIKTKDETRAILGLDSLENLNEVLLSDNSLSDISIKDISEMMPRFDSITESDMSMELPSENIYYVGVTNENDNGETDANEGTTMTFTSSAVEVCTEVLECGEVIEYDNELSKDKKVLKSSGKYGIKEVTYDVTYLNGEELTRTMISEEIIKEPVPKVYRVGTKKITGTDFIYAAPGESEPGATGTFIIPTSGQMTSRFSNRDLFGKIEFHGALDIANKAGTPVFASDGGKVILAEWFDSYGKCIIIDHGHGFTSLYAHLSSYSVKKGDVVGQGWQIGTTGMTGRVTGNHLHFEIRIDDKKVDPEDYLVK